MTPVANRLLQLADDAIAQAADLSAEARGSVWGTDALRALRKIELALVQIEAAQYWLRALSRSAGGETGTPTA